MKIHLSLRFLDVDHLFILVCFLKGKTTVEISRFLLISQSAVSQRTTNLNNFFAFDVFRRVKNGRGKKLVLTKKGDDR